MTPEPSKTPRTDAMYLRYHEARESGDFERMADLCLDMGVMADDMERELAEAMRALSEEHSRAEKYRFMAGACLGGTDHADRIAQEASGSYDAHDRAYKVFREAQDATLDAWVQPSREYAERITKAALHFLVTFNNMHYGRVPDEVDAARIALATALREGKDAEQTRTEIDPVPDKLPCAVACDCGPTFGKGVSVDALLHYLGRRVRYNADESFKHTCGLPEDDWSRDGPSKDCPLCKARASFKDMRCTLREVQSPSQVPAEEPKR